MNHSIHSADRATHLKIVVVALVAGIAVAGFGIAARTNVGLQPDRAGHQSRQAGGGHKLGHLDGSLVSITSETQQKRPPSGGLFVVQQAVPGTALSH